MVVSPLTLFSAICWSVAAYVDPKGRKAYTTAGILIYATAAYMKAEQWSAIRKLYELTTSMEMQHNTSTEEVDGWLEKWANLHITRSTWAAMAGFIGLFAASYGIPRADYEHSFYRTW